MPFSALRSLFTHKAKLLALAATASVIFTVGCGMGALAPATSAPQANGTLTGMAHGGRQAITGANVFVMAAGDVGYGSPAEILAETTTDNTGYFSFASSPYTCPTAGSTPYSDTLYLIIAGGNPGVNGSGTTTSNPASVLMSVLGDCATVVLDQPFVDVTEVSTFAGMTAMQQFFNPAYNSALSSATPPAVNTAVSTENFGTATGNIQGLSNAASTAASLVNMGTGISAGTTTRTNLGVTMTVRPETDKMYAAANVLAACVNSTGTGSPCSDLFADLTGSSTITDVLIASYNMANTENTVGSANVAAVCALGGSYAPFSQTTYTCAAGSPYDWTLGLYYNTTSTFSGNPVFSYPQYVAVDSQGDIWVANHGAPSGVVELSPNGFPQNIVLESGSTGGIPAGGSANWITLASTNNNDYVYVSATDAGADTTVAGFNMNLSSAKAFTVGADPEGMAADGTGNVYVASVGSGALWEINATTSTASAISGTLIATSNSGVAVDENYNVFVTGGSSSNAFITPYLYSSSGYTIGSTTTAAGILSPAGAAFDTDNVLWVPNDTSSSSVVQQTLAKNALAPTTGAINANVNYPGGGLFQAGHVAIDGGGNAWVADDAAGSGVAEFTSNGIALSPAGATAVAPYGFTHGPGGFTPFMIAPDGSGNVWVGNAGIANGGLNGIEEIVGAAVPVVTPIAKGLASFAGGPSNLGTRPLTGYNFNNFTVSECASTCTGGGVPGVPTITLTEDTGNPLPFTTTLVGTVNGALICTTNGTYSNTAGTQISCVGPANSLTPGAYVLNGSLTGDGVEYGANSGQIPFTVDP